MNANDVPRMHIREPGDVAQLVPHLIGFQPEESLVDRGHRSRAGSQVTARVDIADVHPPGRAEDLLDRIWNRFPDADAYLMAYTNDQAAGWALLRRCEDHLPPFADRQRHARRRRHLAHRRRPVPARSTATAGLAAEAAFHGLPVLEQPRRSARPVHQRRQPRPSSAQLADQAIGCPPATANDMPALVDTVRRPDRHATCPSPASQPSRGGHEPARRPAAVGTRRHDPRPSGSRAAVDDQRQRRTAPAAVAQRHQPDRRRGVTDTPLHLAGMAAWITGDGATADIALERAQAAPRPETRPFVLLDALIDHVVPPNSVDRASRRHPQPDRPAPRQAVEGPATPAEQPMGSRPAHPNRPRPDPHQGKPLNPPAPGIAI